MLTETQAHDLKIMHDLAVKAAMVAYAATPGTQTKRLKERAAEKADAKFNAALCALRSLARSKLSINSQTNLTTRRAGNMDAAYERKLIDAMRPWTLLHAASFWLFHYTPREGERPTEFRDGAYREFLASAGCPDVIANVITGHSRPTVATKPLPMSHESP